MIEMRARFISGAADELRRALEELETNGAEHALRRCIYAQRLLRAACERPERDLVEDLSSATYRARLAGLADMERRLQALTEEAQGAWNAAEHVGGGTYVTKTAFGDRTGD